MDRRVRERRRSLGKERGRRRASLIFAIIATLSVAGMFLWLRSSDVFAVRRVTCTAMEYVTPGEISRATAGARGVSLLRISTGAIADRLATLPYVRSVEVYRRFPNTLDVRLVEYEPAARLQASDGSVWLVASDGRVLGKTLSNALTLLVPTLRTEPVAGEQVPKTVIAALPLVALLADKDVAGSLPPVGHVNVSVTGQVVVVLKEGTEVRLGDPDRLKQKLMVAATVVEQYLRDGTQLAYVDASVPDRVAVNAK